MAASQNKDKKDYTALMRLLDPKQRKVLALFQNYDEVTSQQIGEIFGFKSRTNTALCQKWVKAGFLDIVNPSNKARKYKLAKPYNVLVEDKE